MTGRSGVLLVARRELLRVRERAFQVSAGISIVAIAVVAFLPTFIDGDTSYEVAVSGSDRQALGQAITQVADAAEVDVSTRELADVSAARAEVFEGDVDAAVVDNDEVISEDELEPDLFAVLQAAHAAVRSDQELRERGLDPAEVAAALDVEPLAETHLRADPDEAVKQNIALVGVIVLFGQLIGYGSWIALGVVEEKSGRVVELLLSALRPWQLLGGKVLGIGLLALTQLLLTVVVGVATVLLSGSFTIPGAAYGTIAQVVGWFVLGYGFFAAAYAAAASLVSRQEDVGAVTGPMTMVMMAGYFAAIFVSFNPESTFAKVISFVPPFSAMTMPGRSVDEALPWWQLGVSALVMVAATLALVRVAGRIYGGAVLNTGSRVRITDALRAEEPAAG